MKEELTAAAERAFQTGKWWYASGVIPSDDLADAAEVFADTGPGMEMEPFGEDAAWYLLLCAEALSE